MKIELNLWFNKTNTNGQLNINAGESVYKFNNLIDLNKFVNEGIQRGIGDDDFFLDLAHQLELDPDAKYAWINSQNDFIYMNTKNKFAHAFFDKDMYILNFNTLYTPKSKYSPHASYFYKV